MDAYSHLSSLYDTLMADIPYDQWIKYITEALASNGISQGAAVLDVGCGTGKVSIGLSKAGYKVTGLDVSEEMLRLAEENSRRAGLNIPFICQPIAEAEIHQKVDAVTAVCDVVNYLAGSELDAFFQSAGRLIKYGGMLIFDISSPYKLRQIIGDNIFFEDRDDVTYIWTNVLESDAVAMEIIMFIGDGERYMRQEETHTQHVYEPDVLVKKLAECGFKRIRLTDGYQNKQLEEHTERITITAFKE